jgi:hypothetical protein
MFDNLRRRLAWRAELRELDQKQAPATLAKPDDSNPGRLLWCLPVPGKTDVFMALEKGEHADHDRFVVPVNAVAFNRLWLAGGLNSRERPDGCLLRRDMPADSKYRHAAACFAEGPQSPVPLASVSLECSRDGTQSVSFGDGVTRTFWLLANNVAAFPVLIAGEAAAKQLAQLAGTDGSTLRVSEAFRQVEKAPAIPQKPVSTNFAAGKHEARGRGGEHAGIGQGEYRVIGAQIPVLEFAPGNTHFHGRAGGSGLITRGAIAFHGEHVRAIASATRVQFQCQIGMGIQAKTDCTGGISRGECGQDTMAPFPSILPATVIVTVVIVVAVQYRQLTAFDESSARLLFGTHCLNSGGKQGHNCKADDIVLVHMSSSAIVG